MSQRSSAFGGSTMSAASATSLTPRRFPSALERNNPDVRPSILALVDTSKPISQQVDQIKAATQRETGSPSPRVTSGDSDVFRHSQRGPPRSNASHHSVRSFGSFGLTPSTRRQTSGELGKGDDGLIVAMRKKAAEERRKKHLREMRASQAGSTVSRSVFGASRVSNSSFGISRIGLHSSTGSRGTSAVSSRASSPEAAKPESPYAALAARARGALFENTRGIQEAKAERRKEEARKREMERERQRRDARMEMLARLAAEEEEERLRREEELLSASNRKRDAAGTLRYSPEDTMDNSVHPYGKEAKDPRKRSLAADSLTRGQQPAKRSRSSEPAEERPRSSDRKLMPPPPAPTSQHFAATPSPPRPFTTNQGSSSGVSFGIRPEEMAVEEEEREEASDNRPANDSVEPEIGTPVSLFQPSNAPLGGAPIARDFAYPGGPVFNPEPVHAGSDTEPDEDQEDDEADEQEVVPKKGSKQPEVVSLLDSDDEDEDAEEEEETFEGFGDYDDEDEEGEGDDEISDEDEEENGSSGDDNDEGDDEEPMIIPICSSPVPESVHEDSPETNGAIAHIPKSLLAEEGVSNLTAQKPVVRNNVRATRSRSSTAQTSSQEKLWMRDSGGRLMRSASPESVGIALAAPSNDQDAPNEDDHDVPNDDDHNAPNDDETAGSELPIDPLLNPSVDVAIPAVAHAH
ncbi:hypothetical protein TWF173_001978 [Orbilia oligospora]|nr:hypothetical protein TWF173_001978 [Orbilia oligospora]